MAKYTTFHIGGKARYFLIAKSESEIIGAIKTAQKLKLPFFILGGGSNLLVSDKGYKGLVIRIQNEKIKMQNENGEFKIICDAGVSLAKLVVESARIGAAGFEWSSGVPGTLGGAVFGAAGAFGGGIAEIVKSVKVYDFEKDKIKVFKNKDCRFAYRESIFKKNRNFIVLSVELLLKKEKKETIKEKIKGCLDYRRSRQPQEPSAGSVFKNVSLKKISSRFFEKFPEARTVVKENNLPAAYLIAHVDLTGKKIGGAMVSSKHPNFIVNFKNAKAKDVKKLIGLIKKVVKNKFGLTLEEEIQHLGF